MLDREGFSLEYPRNWSLDTADPDFDPDRSFFIDTAGHSTLWLGFPSSGIDPAVIVEHLLYPKARFGLRKRRSEFRSWGAFDGFGVRFEKWMWCHQHLLVFAHSDVASFVILIHSFADDISVVEPGVELIRDTLLLK